MIDARDLEHGLVRKNVPAFGVMLEQQEQIMTGIDVAFLVLVIAAFGIFGVSLYIVDRRCNAPDREAGTQRRGSRPAQAQQTGPAVRSAPSQDRPQQA